MKETINANIGSVAFTLEEDAYRTLKNYLKRIENRLPADDKDSLGDIERRIAELLSAKPGIMNRVITYADIQQVMEQIGAPEDFGAPREAEQEEKRSNHRTTNSRSLYRPIHDRSIAGVCSGLALQLGVDSSLVRLATILLVLFGGLSIWVYVILWIVIPEEPIKDINVNKQ